MNYFQSEYDISTIFPPKLRKIVAILMIYGSRQTLKSSQRYFDMTGAKINIFQNATGGKLPWNELRSSYWGTEMLWCYISTTKSCCCLKILRDEMPLRCVVFGCQNSPDAANQIALIPSHTSGMKDLKELADGNVGLLLWNGDVPNGSRRRAVITLC